jgi:hypothetical protein
MKELETSSFISRGSTPAPGARDTAPGEGILLLLLLLLGVFFAFELFDLLLNCILVMTSSGLIGPSPRGDRDRDREAALGTVLLASAARAAELAAAAVDHMFYIFKRHDRRRMDTANSLSLQL